MQPHELASRVMDVEAYKNTEYIDTLHVRVETPNNRTVEDCLFDLPVDAHFEDFYNDRHYWRTLSFTGRTADEALRRANAWIRRRDRLRAGTYGGQGWTERPNTTERDPEFLRRLGDGAEYDDGDET